MIQLKKGIDHDWVQIPHKLARDLINHIHVHSRMTTASVFVPIHLWDLNLHPYKDKRSLWPAGFIERCPKYEPYWVLNPPQVGSEVRDLNGNPDVIEAYINHRWYLKNMGWISRESLLTKVMPPY